ncbi:dynamin family protein [Hirsutella rhossiliensis]|uniref:Dynamin family domain-containing protein n=1 Tax=Hirsutella rhossiliensis TaxID=111463 RepID=A0A9P8N0M9_9HYPO|nr:dynamin family domain-containing protein [Hirsutella rhossiliensis]KAH0963779.1 dynamin family domain-containing protein [Hirsutella rhossiliensis]
MAALGSELGNAAMLAKIDKLRELNVGSLVPLPQLVVVGDQSSGKSSVLESLTGLSFPRDVGLCTRFAAQISCCRDTVKVVTVSIIPRPDADDKLKAKLLGFNRQINDLSNDDLAKIFQEASTAMGIRMTTDSEDPRSGAFSQDILKIEIHGPDKSHLTVIDVPGIFRLTQFLGLTTSTDITLVESMVKSYMSNNRTIILAVMPCNVDIATQEILKLAEAADPDGARTMGVLTKPDLATEAATRDAVMDLVLGKRSKLKLGYYVVKNRSADDKTSTLAQRVKVERAFFMAPPWTNVGDRCGIAALKERLRRLLMKVSKDELPHVKGEIKERLRKCKADLETKGPARADQNSQRQYLGKLAGRFQAVSQAALNGYYAGERIFKTHPELKLITRVTKLNEDFSDVFWSRGHRQHFGKVEKNEAEPYGCPEPWKTPIMECIRNAYQSSRGPELGTYGGTVLSTVFEQQSEKWELLATSHASNAIVIVHDFIFQLIAYLCPDEQVKDQLWANVLVEKLRERYKKAMDHTRFLLSIERGGRPSTFNHYFGNPLQSKRAERLYQPLLQKVEKHSGFSGHYVEVSELKRHLICKKNADQVCEDILDTLASYYKLARKRFVDVLCQQVVSHFLLDGAESPIAVFSPEFVMGLDSDQLEMIAGEDEESKEQRQTLERETQSLEATLKVLRT